MRFLYGFRTAGPIALGMTTLPVPVFAVANAVGAAVWAAVISAVGWFFGQAATRMLDDVQRHEGWIALAIAILGGGGVLAYRIYLRRTRTIAA